MKKMIVFAACMVLIATAAFAGIAGTRHDLSTTTATGTREICVFCHTPHSARVADGPLWNRSALTTAFTMYTIQASTTVMGVDTNMSNASKGCMTCHDGVTALGAVANLPGLTNPVGGTIAVVNGTIGLAANIGNTGGNLSNDHPIAILYHSNKGLRTPTANGTVPTVIVTGTNAVSGDDNTDRVQCESCHDVHDDTNSSFLRAANTIGSALCLTCHLK